MIVRQDQLNVLRDASVAGFRTRMAEHLEALFPGYVKALQVSELHDVIRFGIEKAASHNFRTEISVCRYIDLMFLLGGGFDTDPQLSWAGEILNDAAPEGDVGRMQILYHRAEQYLDVVAGPDNAYSRAAVNRFVSSPLVLPYAGRLEQKLQEIYPEKARALGEPALQVLVESGARKAQHYGLASREGAQLVASLCFALGSGFDIDLKFPWAQTSLKQRAVAGETDAIQSLYHGALGFLRVWMNEGGARV